MVTKKKSTGKKEVKRGRVKVRTLTLNGRYQQRRVSLLMSSSLE